MGARGILIGAAVVAGGAAAGAAALAGRGAAQADPDRWNVITIGVPIERLRDLPAPLAALGDAVEVRVEPAPGDRGTELAARPVRRSRADAASIASLLVRDDPRDAVRVALRDAKQLLEVGEIHRIDPKPHGRRPATPAGALLDRARSRAKGAGVL